MSFFIGYHDGTRQGRCFTLPDLYHGIVGDADADHIAEQLRRELGREPHIQTVRGRVIRLAKSRMADQ